MNFVGFATCRTPDKVHPALASRFDSLPKSANALPIRIVSDTWMYKRGNSEYFRSSVLIQSKLKGTRSKTLFVKTLFPKLSQLLFLSKLKLHPCPTIRWKESSLLFFIPLFFTKGKIFSLEISGGKFFTRNFWDEISLIQIKKRHSIARRG